MNESQETVMNENPKTANKESKKISKKTANKESKKIANNETIKIKTIKIGIIKTETKKIETEKIGIRKNSESKNSTRKDSIDNVKYKLLDPASSKIRNQWKNPKHKIVKKNMTHKEGKNKIVRGNVLMKKKSADKLPNLTSTKGTIGTIAMISISRDVDNVKPSGPDPKIENNVLLNVIKGNQQDEDHAVDKTKIAMNDGEDKGEGTTEDLMQGMIFILSVGDSDLTVHQKVTRVTCQTILRKWTSSTE